MILGKKFNWTLLVVVFAVGFMQGASKVWKDNRPDGKYEYGFVNSFIKFVNFTPYPVNIQLYKPTELEAGYDKVAFTTLPAAKFDSKGVKDQRTFFVFREDDFGKRRPCVTKLELSISRPAGKPTMFTYEWDPAKDAESFFCKRRGTEFRNIFGKKPIFGYSRDYTGYYVAIFEKDGGLYWWYGVDYPKNTEKVLSYVEQRYKLLQEIDDLKKQEPKDFKKAAKIGTQILDLTKQLQKLDVDNSVFWS